jgi:polyhydroxyalkanoate synthesis regulator phasin
MANKSKSGSRAKPKAAARAKGADDASRAEQSVEAFRHALETSVTISRDKLQDVVDDAVRRGRMTRKDAEDLVNGLVARGREQADDILSQLESLVSQLGGGVADRTAQQRRSAARTADRAKRELTDAADRARREVGTRAEGARKRAVKAVDQPLATADRAKRMARVPGFPISAYDQLTSRQVTNRLPDLTRDELRRVRDYERGNKARKGVLRTIDRRLKK